MPVSTANPELSPGLTQQTRHTTYELFTPNDSGQRSDPTYYRGCWHVVGRSLFPTYRQPRPQTGACVSGKRGLQPEGRHPPRGVAASGFRPLRKIPHCCLPQESGPCLSPSVAGRPLRPATRNRLGRPLPHQQADRPRAPPRPDRNPFHTPPCSEASYPVLDRVSPAYPRVGGRSLTCYSPFRRSCTQIGRASCRETVSIASAAASLYTYIVSNNYRLIVI